jgi:hypothetical protein
VFYADTSESDSGASYTGSEIFEAHVSSNWLQVTDCGPRPNTYISVQNIQLKAIVPSGFGWTTQACTIFSFFFFLIWMCWNIVQEMTLNGNKMENAKYAIFKESLESQTGHLQL